MRQMSRQAEQGLFLASYLAGLEDPGDFSDKFSPPVSREDLSMWPSSQLELLSQFLADQRAYMTRKRQKYQRLASFWLAKAPPSEPDPPPPPKELNRRLLTSPIDVTSLLTQRFGLISTFSPPARGTTSPGPHSVAMTTTLIAAMVPVGQRMSDIPDPMEETVIDTGAVWYPKLPFERRLAIEMEAIGLGSTHAVFGPRRGGGDRTQGHHSGDELCQDAPAQRHCQSNARDHGA
jgi:hypothetical protein